MKSLSTREREVNYATINFREVDEGFANILCEHAGETEVKEWAGYDRICDFSGSFSCHRNSCDCDFSTEVAGVMGRDNVWDGAALGQRVLFEFAKLEKKAQETCAQGTVEFAIVAVVIVLIVVGLAAVLGRLSDGTFLAHAITAASHNISSSVSGVVDAFCY